MQEGERQVAPTLAGIRHDHVARYKWAANRLPKGASVLELGCGVGYGSKVLADAGANVVAVDKDLEALAYGRKHYRHPRVMQHQADLRRLKLPEQHFDAVVCFEVIEHLADPLPVLKKMREFGATLIVSVPNEDEFPWEGYAFHYRHYTPGQFRHLLEAAGWDVTEWWGQRDDESDVEKNVSGRTLIAVARRVEAPKVLDLASGIDPDQGPAPEHVAILGLGPSVQDYLELTKRVGGRHKFADETWGINALGNVLLCDRIFHMDDVRIQEIRAAAKPDGNIAALLPWLKKHPGPVYTSRPHPDYPGMVPFPLEAVVQDTGYAYFNSTAAYAVAYAVYRRVKKISAFGMDFTYAHSHHAEKGRACVEFWLGIAAARGIKLSIPNRSSLMDGCEPARDKLYGYDTVDVTIGRDAKGRHQVKFTERLEPLPTAEDIEHRYDHSVHPNPLVRA